MLEQNNLDTEEVEKLINEGIQNIEELLQLRESSTFDPEEQLETLIDMTTHPERELQKIPKIPLFIAEKPDVEYSEEQLKIMEDFYEYRKNHEQVMDKYNDCIEKYRSMMLKLKDPTQKFIKESSEIKKKHTDLFISIKDILTNFLQSFKNENVNKLLKKKVVDTQEEIKIVTEKVNKRLENYNKKVEESTKNTLNNIIITEKEEAVSGKPSNKKQRNQTDFNDNIHKNVEIFEEKYILENWEKDKEREIKREIENIMIKYDKLKLIYEKLTPIFTLFVELINQLDETSKYDYDDMNQQTEVFYKKIDEFKEPFLELCANLEKQNASISQSFESNFNIENVENAKNTLETFQENIEEESKSIDKIKSDFDEKQALFLNRENFPKCKSDNKEGLESLVRQIQRQIVKVYKKEQAIFCILEDRELSDDFKDDDLDDEEEKNDEIVGKKKIEKKYKIDSKYLVNY